MARGPTVHDRLDFLATGPRPWILLVLLGLALFLPGITALPPVDRDEARYIQASRQMLETGDYLNIRFQDEARNKKPAGIYWLQSLSMGLFGNADSNAVWPYRLVSVAGALGGVLLLFAIGGAIFDRRTALLAAALLASSVGLVFEAHVATTDAVLLACGIAAEGILGLAYLAARRGEGLSPYLAAAFWIAEIAAIFIKGPVIAALTLLTAVTLMIADRRGRWLLLLRPIWGLPLVILTVGPWLWLMQSHTGGDFLHESVGHDLVGKLTGGQESHGAPPGYYLLLLPATFWPASFFLGAAFLWLWRTRRLPASRLLLAWIVPFWILIELVPTKLPHYALPVYPALALASARAILSIAEEGMTQQRGWFRPLFPWFWACSGVLGGAALLALPPLLHEPLMIGGAIAFAAVMTGSWQLIRRERLRIRLENVAVAISVALVTLPIAFGLVLPGLEPIWLSQSAAALVGRERKADETLSSTGYAEPSLVFLLGTKTRLLAAEPAAAALVKREVDLALVSSGDDAAFKTALADRRAELAAVGSVTGFDYSTGKWLILTLYRLVPPAG